jgi:hypothetical protein
MLPRTCSRSTLNPHLPPKPHAPRSSTQYRPHSRTRTRPHNRNRIIPTRRLQQRSANRPTHQRRTPNHRKRHAQSRARFVDVRRVRGDGSGEETLERSTTKSVHDGPSVESWDRFDGEPGPEDNDVADEAEDEDVENTDKAVCEIAGEDSCGKSDAVEDNDHVERSGVRHVERVAGEGGNLSGIS